MTGRADLTHESLCIYPKGSLLEQLEEENQGGLANAGWSGKWPLKIEMQIGK